MYIIHTEIALQCAHHLFTEIINRLPLKNPSKLLKAGQVSVQEGQCYQYSREWICFQCTWQASVQTHDDISHSQDHTSIFTCSCKPIGWTANAYGLYPSPSQSGKASAIFKPGYAYGQCKVIPCAEEEKGIFKFFNMLSLFLAVFFFLCAYSLFPWNSEGPSRNFCNLQSLN